MKARKKPVVVDVMQLKMLSARSYRKCKEFVGDAWIDADELARNTLPCIKNLEGIMTISDGDYIIKGVNGEFYPCKPDVFEKTYEIVEKDNDLEEKLFFIDDFKKDINFDSYEAPYSGYVWGVKMTRKEFNKIKECGFNPNTTNSRAYNTGYLKAFLGRD